MSDENVEIVRRMWVAFRDRDWVTAFEPVDANIEEGHDAKSARWD